MSVCPDCAWVAVHVRNKREKCVAEQLRLRGYEEFLPLYAPGTSTVRKPVQLPLFPGYVFCRYLSRPSWRIVQIPGVLRIVGDGHGALSVIPDKEVDAIRRVVSTNIYAEPWRYLEVGQRVHVVSGPLKDLEGTVAYVKGRVRIVLSVVTLQRSVAVEVTRDQVRPVDPAWALEMAARALQAQTA